MTVVLRLSDLEVGGSSPPLRTLYSKSLVSNILYTRNFHAFYLEGFF
jgi:hypothetical protein